MTKIDDVLKSLDWDVDSQDDKIVINRDDAIPAIKKAIAKELNEIDWIKRRIIDEKRKHGKEGVAWAKIAQEKIKSEIKKILCGDGF